MTKQMRCDHRRASKGREAVAGGPRDRLNMTSPGTRDPSRDAPPVFLTDGARAWRGRAGDHVRARHPRGQRCGAGYVHRRSPRTSAFRAESQARRVHAHARRSAAAGSLRLQAWAAGLVRQGPARFRSAGPTADNDVVGAGAISNCAVRLQICAARRERRVGIRAAAAHGEDG